MTISRTRRELSRKEMAQIRTGSLTAMIFPPGTRGYDIKLALSDKRPIPINKIMLSEHDLSTLGYFSRDLREMLKSAFFQEGPGKLSWDGQAERQLQTSASDEQIRSFVTIFRRLYMEKEPAGFLKAVEVFTRVTSGYALGSWVASVGEEYRRKLREPPAMFPLIDRETFCIKRKRLIDVTIYTQYAHQPCHARSKQYNKCLTAVGHRHGLLTWICLSTMWECSLHMKNAGLIITRLLDAYCDVNHISRDILESIAITNPGIGQLENRRNREQRLTNEAESQLSQRLWTEAGEPQGGPAEFIAIARQRLRDVMS